MVPAIVLVAIMAILAFQGCVGTSSSSTKSVEIKDNAFNPSILTVKTGATVTWFNNDTVTHTVTSDDGSFQSSGNISPGQTYSVTFNNARSFHYHDSINPQMTAQIVVQSGSLY